MLKKCLLVLCLVLSCNMPAFAGSSSTVNATCELEQLLGQPLHYNIYILDPFFYYTSWFNPDYHPWRICNLMAQRFLCPSVQAYLGINEITMGITYNTEPLTTITVMCPE